MNQFHVLYRDLSGVFGQWYKRDNEWVFKSSHPILGLSDDDMKYALSELEKGKETNKGESKMNKDYAKLKAVCKIEGCHCPEEHTVRIAEANTPTYLRLWFKIR